MTTASSAAHLELIPTVSDTLPAGGLAAILADPERNQRLIDALASIAVANAGVDLDFEQFAFADDRSTWTATSAPTGSRQRLHGALQRVRTDPRTTIPSETRSRVRSRPTGASAGTAAPGPSSPARGATTDTGRWAPGRFSRSATLMRNGAAATGSSGTGTGAGGNTGSRPECTARGRVNGRCYQRRLRRRPADRPAGRRARQPSWSKNAPSAAASSGSGSSGAATWTWSCSRPRCTWAIVRSSTTSKAANFRST